MLQKLIIRNYAIIDNLTIEPAGHLNIVTGETGAGKSIILGALSLILGDRADTSVLIHKDQKCVVEAHFDVHANTSFRQALQQAELDDDAVCIIRREISSAGKSRAFVNDSPVTLNVLNRLTAVLVDLHQQFGHLALEDDHFQQDVVDALAANNLVKTKYQETFQAWQATIRQLQLLQDRQVQWQKESDYKQYLYEELSQAAFTDNEVEQADEQLKQLTHAERIISTLRLGRTLLEEGEQPLTNELRKLSQQLSGITDVMKDLEPLQERLQSAYAELKDIASELERLETRMELDPEKMVQLQERVDLGYRLFKKHAVTDTAGLLQVHADLEAELQDTLSLEAEIVLLQQKQQTLISQLEKDGKTLSASRKKVLPALEKQLNELLRVVGMPNARFRVDMKSLNQPTAGGFEEVVFLLDANQSGQFQPVYKAASGGEMSRIMLCLKSLTAQAMQLPTLIFDEVDTGISGEAALQVGRLLEDLGKHHQIICITHQPQVAARGARHFFVYKDLDADNRITTRVRVLGAEEKVEAIARMIGGEKPSEAAIANARELVVNAV